MEMELMLLFIFKVFLSSIVENSLTERRGDRGAIYDLFQDPTHIVLCSMWHMGREAVGLYNIKETKLHCALTDNIL